MKGNREHSFTITMLLTDSTQLEQFTLNLPDHQLEQSQLDRLCQHTISSKELILLLEKYQLLQQLQRELLIDQTIAPFTCAPEELTQGCNEFCQSHQITSDHVLQAWLVRNNLTMRQWQESITRNIKIEKFKQALWENKLESYFLKRKGQLDRIVYSLLRVKDPHIAQELYFRIREGEQSFGDLAGQYSEGPEAQTSGLIGPVELNVPHPQLTKQLIASQPGQLLTPMSLGEWVVIARLEKLLPAQLDQAMRQRLMNELFEQWIKEQLNPKQSVQ